jgi:recombinational DNA repair protein (RecF pathway)
MKRAALIVLLTACAPQAASLPWVTIDRSLSGVVCSREAAVAIAQRRIEERGEWQKKILDREEQAAIAKEQARQAQFWARHAPWMIPSGILLGLTLGATVGVALAIGIMR